MIPLADLLALDLALSMTLFLLYAWDKAAAKRRSRRVPERTLQSFALLGGWPGAFLAGRMFRHKTANSGFQRVFRTMVALNLLATLALAAHDR